jgi:hypothetical protein
MHEKPHCERVRAAPAVAWAIALLTAAPTPVRAAEPSTTTPSPRVRVIVESRRDRGPVRLHARLVEVERTRWIERVSRTTWEACVAPCDAVVDTRSGAAGFFVDGPRVSPSRVFTLPEAAEVDLVVRPRPRGVRGLGIGMAALGGAGIVAGALTMLVADGDARRLLGGGVTLAAALPVVVVGAILARWGRTRVDVRPRL